VADPNVNVRGMPDADAMDDRSFILMQLADEEYLLSLEAFQALREHNKSVEMYVFPKEHHIKWQPVHRFAIYNRNIDWFSFWLRSYIDPDPSKKAQYERWKAMRILANKGPQRRHM